MDSDIDETIAELRRTVAGLDRQVDQLRSALLTAACWSSAVLLLLGVLMPYADLERGQGFDKARRTANVLGVIGGAFGSTSGDGGSDPVGTLFGIAFTGLVVVVLLGFVVLRLVGSRRGTTGQVTFARIVTIVLLVGCAGAWLTVLLAMGNSASGFYPAVILLTLGAAVLAGVVLPKKAQTWWVGGTRPNQPQPFDLFNR